MKSFLKGLEIFAVSLWILLNLITSGCSFYTTATSSGFLAVLFFVFGIICLFLAILAIWFMGEMYEIEQGGADNG